MRKYLSISLIALLGIGVYFFFLSKTKEPQNMDIIITEICDYLEKQKSQDDTEGIWLTTQYSLDENNGMVYSVDIHGGFDIDFIMPFFENAEDIRKVKAIPTLACPLVNIGDIISGNTEKLYYTSPKTESIFEIKLRNIDSVALLLHVTDVGTPYQKVIEFYTDRVIKSLKKDIDFSETDVITVEENEKGRFLQSIEIKNPTTAELLFRCIKNSVWIYDLTGDSLSPEFLPIEIGGYACGNFNSFYYFYPITGQLIKFCFSDEDSLAFKTHIMTMVG